MSDTFRAVILGIVEGLTEFLPVSSTGHMILVEPLLGIDDAAPVWRVFLFVSQFAAILAVVLYFFRDLWRRTFRPAVGGWQNHILTKLFVAMIPTGILGALFDDLMETYLLNPPVVAVALIVGAIAIELIERNFRRTGGMTLEDVTLRQALAIGALQCLAMVPGTSRSGATIMGGMVLGLTPAVAAEFSFYLAIPTMLAASLKQLFDYYHLLKIEHVGVILVGSAVSFVVALAVVAWFMAYVRKYRFRPFAIYRVILGVIVLVWWWSAA
ncbi:MAG: undecaprenyl-diphosphate phosphatase [Planctomycetota bacterium]|nr:MAG: undecaprenyl-diphosphate phosphatase [Planctomycetota bacterium]